MNEYSREDFLKLSRDPDRIREMHGDLLLPPIPRDVLKDRIRRCKALIEKGGFDAFLIYSSGETMSGSGWARYFANYKHPLFNSEVFIFIPLDGEPTLIMNYFRFMPVVKQWAPSLKDIRAYDYFASPLDKKEERYTEMIKILRDVVEEKGLGRGRIGWSFGGEQGHFHPALVEKAYKKACPDAILEDATDLTYELLYVKTDYDIKMIRRAHEVADKGGKAALESLKIGDRCTVAQGAFLESTLNDGAENARWDCRIGKYGDIPNSNQDIKMQWILRKGDLAYADYGIGFMGYVTDVGYSFVMGEPSARQRRLFDACLQVHKKMFEVIKPGTRVGDIAKIAEEETKKAGYYPHVMQGHGTGYFLNEPPLGLPWNNFVLRKGMVISIEPCMFEKVGGNEHVGVEDTYLITEDGAVRLSVKDQELYIAR